MDYYNTIDLSPEIQLSKTNEEISLKNTDVAPLKVFIDELPASSLGFAKNHWHNTLQFNVVLRGKVEFSVNGITSVLHVGEGIFINSGILHFMNNCMPDGSTLFSFQVDPFLFSGQNYIQIYKKYVQPVINGSGVNYLLFREDIPWQAEILDKLNDAFEKSYKKELGYELIVKRDMIDIWLIILKSVPNLLKKDSSANNTKDDFRIKQMLNFIHNNYSKAIGLRDIAQAGNISESECCRCFNRELKKTPINYLIGFRIGLAAGQLISTDEAISAIIFDAGFSDISYFYKVFQKQLKCTPKQYREQYSRKINKKIII